MQLKQARGRLHSEISNPHIGHLKKTSQKTEATGKLPDRPQKKLGKQTGELERHGAQKPRAGARQGVEIGIVLAARLVNFPMVQKGSPPLAQN